MRHHRPMADGNASNSEQPDSQMLIQIAQMRMPFGRYSGTRLIDLPEPYVVWFQKHGYPRGRLGSLLATLYEIKANGLEPLLASLREPSDPRYRAVDPRTFKEGDR
jgi:hypothetical protein